MSNTDRRKFLQLMGLGALTTSLKTNIAKALEIPAHHRTGTIHDVEHVVILMQENRPFDHHFGTLRGVRGFADPRAADINLPLQSGSGTTPASVFLQPAGANNVKAGFGVSPSSVGGPANGAAVIPPFRVNPASVSAGLNSLGSVYLPGTGHGWGGTHAAWNLGAYDNWAIQKGPMAMSYMTREDLPYHYALADAFTVGDNYYSSIMGPTNPNRCYMWTGCIGNVDYLGAGGTDGKGGGPVTSNGLPNNAYLAWETFPEVLQEAGVTWKIYQDLAGATFAPDFGDGTGNSFAGNYTDNSVLYFNRYATASPGTPLFDNAATGTQLATTMPSSSAPADAWQSWAEGLFAQFKNDVTTGKLPQVSWIVAPAGYTEHSNYPMNYGAWYISQIFNILVSNPDVFSKTVFIINYDEADGSFDHIVPPTPPQSPVYGASTVSVQEEIVTTSTPNGPIGLGQRVPLIVISPWSKGGYVNSQVFDHTSTIQFIEKRFGVKERNISPWRRAVAGDLTSIFNFANPNGHDRDDDDQVKLPSTSGFLPSVSELAGNDGPTFTPSLSTVILGVPAQEKGIRRARALPYKMDVHASVSNGKVSLTFVNSGSAAVVFQVRSGNTADPVRSYTVEAGKTLADTWNAASSYNLAVYGPNGFARYFNGSTGSSAGALDVIPSYGDGDSDGDCGSIGWKITNLAARAAIITILDAYTGKSSTHTLQHQGTFVDKLSLDQFHGWYDLIITVAGDSSFKYRLAGHVENGRDSYSDPALGGLVALKG